MPFKLARSAVAENKHPVRKEKLLCTVIAPSKLAGADLRRHHRAASDLLNALSGILGCCADYFNHGADASRAYQLPYPGLASQLHEQEIPIERHGYMTNLLGDRTAQTVESYARSREPFLLSLHLTAPHWPWEGPDDEAESRRIRSIMDRDGGTQRTYAAMVQSLDANIGRVLKALDVTGLANNTIEVFNSDNGGER